MIHLPLGIEYIDVIIKDHSNKISITYSIQNGKRNHLLVKYFLYKKILYIFSRHLIPPLKKE